jgi:hypothetical protein
MAGRNKSTPNKSDSNFIQGAIKKPGQLHRDLGVPQGEKIPAAKLDAAAQRGGKVGQRARFAKTLKKMR